MAKRTSGFHFEQALSELEDVVQHLESGELSLEESLTHLGRRSEGTALYVSASSACCRSVVISKEIRAEALPFRSSAFFIVILHFAPALATASQRQRI